MEVMLGIRTKAVPVVFFWLVLGFSLFMMSSMAQGQTDPRWQQVQAMRNQAQSYRQQAAQKRSQRVHIQAQVDAAIQQQRQGGAGWYSGINLVPAMQAQINALSVEEARLINDANQTDAQAQQLEDRIRQAEASPPMELRKHDTWLPPAQNQNDSVGMTKEEQYGQIAGQVVEGMAKSCFIATAAYGTPMANEVIALRAFRDRHLLTNPGGRWLMSQYYELSPPIAALIARDEGLRAAMRGILAPIVFSVRHPGAALVVLILLIAVTIAAKRYCREHCT